MVLKERKCAYSKCRKAFVPSIYFQKYDTHKCQVAANNERVSRFLKERRAKERGEQVAGNEE